MVEIELYGDIWWVEDGVLHIDIPKMLLSVGLPDTEQNRDLAIKIAEEVGAEMMPGVPCKVV